MPHQSRQGGRAPTEGDGGRPVGQSSAIVSVPLLWSSSCILQTINRQSDNTIIREALEAVDSEQWTDEEVSWRKEPSTEEELIIFL